MKDFLLYILFVIVSTIVSFAFLYVATSPSYWYAGMHDGKCEKTLYGGHCKCYERLTK